LTSITERLLAGSVILVGACSPSGKPPVPTADGVPAGLSADHRLSTGARLDPAGRSIAVGNMPIAAIQSPDGRFLVLSLAGWREQGVEVVDRASGAVVQRLEQPGAFLGLAWSADGRTLLASGGMADVVYAYAWRSNLAQPARLADSIELGHADPGTPGSRYPAGLGLSPDGRRLYVAENLSDSLAVVDLPSGHVIQRLGAGSYPYGVAVSPDGRVYVSAWGAARVSVFGSGPDGRLVAQHSIDAGRHPSALVLNADGSRLFVASASTDRVAVVDTRAGRVLSWLLDPPPGGVAEGSTPDALALSPDGTRLYVAEADANAIAVFDLSPLTSSIPTAQGHDRLGGRIPVEWYPTAVVASGDSLWVVNGKGRGAGPNPTGPQPNVPLAKTDPHAYTLGQLNGTISVVSAARGRELEALSHRVAAANGWDAPRKPGANYPPFEHVVYIIKENRTYDQVLGDLRQGDGDTAFTFFPRAISPNHHALAERFGLFDRFFVNAEVSNQGHPWSTSAYVTDFTEKTTPDDYRGKRPEHDQSGDGDAPAAGYIWDAARRKGLSVRDYGEYLEVVPRAAGDSAGLTYRARIPSLQPYISPTYPPFDMAISDQRRADAWLAELREHERVGQMPALEILHLPGDHTAGARPGRCTPKACMADNDLALGRIVAGLSRSRFWRSTIVFVVEDDAQDGPDHVDSHRSVLLTISAWNRGGVLHRFVNTTDVLTTIEEILGLESLSQFDHFGRPLREIWNDHPDLGAYTAVTPTHPLTELNVAQGPDARRSERVDLSRADRVDDDLFNRILWHAVKGPRVPYPAVRRTGVQEFVRGQ
jgi:YVTN family beta-propeller protein